MHATDTVAAPRAAGPVQPADDVGGAAARGEPDHGVAGVDADRVHVRGGRGRAVLRALDGGDEGAGPAREEGDDPVGVHVEVGGHSTASSSPNRPLVPAPR